MFLKKGMVLGILAVGLSSLSLACHAADLKLVNNTDFDSTSKINNDKCSTSIPGGSGVTKAHSTNTVKELYVILACRNDRGNCIADVFLNASCAGTKIATVIIDSNKYTVKDIHMDDNTYNIKPTDGFGFILEKKSATVAK